MRRPDPPPEGGTSLYVHAGADRITLRGAATQG
jgi:hypothetical protein